MLYPIELWLRFRPRRNPRHERRVGEYKGRIGHNQHTDMNLRAVKVRRRVETHVRFVLESTRTSVDEITIPNARPGFLIRR